MVTAIMRMPVCWLWIDGGQVRERGPTAGGQTMTIEQFEHWSLILGVGGLISYMVFIIYRLGKDSNAGRFGLFVLFIALGLGLFGFVAKEILVWMMDP